MQIKHLPKGLKHFSYQDIFDPLFSFFKQSLLQHSKFETLGNLRKTRISKYITFQNKVKLGNQNMVVGILAVFVAF